MSPSETTGPPTLESVRREQDTQRATLLATKLSVLIGSLSLDGVVDRPAPEVLRVLRGKRCILIASAAVWRGSSEVFKPYRKALRRGRAGVLLIADEASAAYDVASQSEISGLLPSEVTGPLLRVAVARAFDLLGERRRSVNRGRWLRRYRYEFGELLDIARAITTETEPDKLLELILRKARFITGADAGSIYVVEGVAAHPSQRLLHFKLSQNDSVSFDAREFTMPISRHSLAGCVALDGSTVRLDDVYAMPSDSPFGFDRSYDRRVGYRTKSMLCAPLISSRGEVVGVLQLINKKRNPSAKLRCAEDFESDVIPFDERSERLLATLTAHAGVSLENAILYSDIRAMFDGFVRASVDTIESRDPATSGHSRRVAALALGLAKALETRPRGPYSGLVFTNQDLRELEYAALLHDFGKIGVREHVLVKAKKLYPEELERIAARFELELARLEIEFLQRKLEAQRSGGAEPELAVFDRELAERRAELAEAWSVVVRANEPTVLAEGDFGRIAALGQQKLAPDSVPLLTTDEVAALSIPKGSLTPAEYAEICSHVVHTQRFLAQIPWGSALARVPSIAAAHHERLDGTGYPNGLAGDEIPRQSKLLAVCDIFDALTALDRPYKHAVSVETALAILKVEVGLTHLDGDLVGVFEEARVWEPVLAHRF